MKTINKKKTLLNIVKYFISILAILGAIPILLTISYYILHYFNFLYNEANFVDAAGDPIRFTGVAVATFVITLLTGILSSFYIWEHMFTNRTSHITRALNKIVVKEEAQDIIELAKEIEQY